MTRYHYRAVSAVGQISTGFVNADDRSMAIAGLRRMGVSPIEIEESRASKSPGADKIGGATKAAVTRTVADMAVLLKAGLPLDRALALVIENIDNPMARARFVDLLTDVKEGMPLSQAMARRGGIFPPTAQAMAEAGEANGRLGEALSRLASALEQAEELRRLVTTAMIYPVILLTISVSVILLMLLFVVPQFESLFATAQGTLPPASRAVMAASQALRAHGLMMLAVLVVVVLVIRQMLAQPATHAAMDRLVLRVPQLGTLIRHIETARFARTLGVLVEGEVPLPNALLLAQRAISNHVIGAAVQTVADGVKEGGGLTAPLAATGVFPRLAIGFLRTGEETSQLGLMLGRLSDVLDADVKVRLQRMIGLLTPAITIFLGTTVAAIIAAIMSAILGFNDLAVS